MLELQSIFECIDQIAALFVAIDDVWRCDPFSAILNVGGSLLGGLIQSDSNRKAVNAQSDAARDSNALQLQMFEQTREDQAPWRAAGQQALTNLTNLLSSGQLTSKFAGDVGSDPGYKFALDEGMRAIDNSAAARGGIGGASLKAGVRFAQGNATRYYNDAFNRFQTERTNTQNPLFQMAGFGPQANQQVALAGQNYANQVGGNMTDAANARAAGGIAQGNIYGNMLNLGLAGWNRYASPGG